ncbi:MAG: putative signal transducing protein [Ruegeria sp.]
MKELLRSTDPTIIAFASALLKGEDIDCFEMDVNMSVLEGGIGIFPRRLMVRTDDLDRAKHVMLDNDIPLGR